MPCTRPVKAYRSPNGKISLKLSDTYTDLDYSIIEVNCMRCFDCRMRHASGWTTRMVHEASLHTHPLSHPDAGAPNNAFVTLTYDEASLPEDRGLNVRDMQLFFKRLRRSGLTFSYLYCGEYGSLRGRPHYHVIFFGQDFSHDREYRGKNAKGFPIWHSQTLSDEWPYGFHEIGEFAPQNAAYTAQYTLKKQNDLDDPSSLFRYDADEEYGWSVLPPFVLTSKNPAIAKNWIKANWRDVYPIDRVILNGREVRPPRFYDRWMEKHQASVWNTVKLNRWHHAEDNQPEWRRLRDREAIQTSKIKASTRDPHP